MEQTDVDSLIERALGELGSGSIRGQKTKLAIIEHAAGAFATGGFQGTSMRSIARSVGIDHSTLLHHFKSKDELLVAVLRWRDVSGGRQVAGSGIGPEITADTLAEGVRTLATANAEDADLTRLFSIMVAEAGQEGHPARQYLQWRQKLAMDFWQGFAQEAGSGSGDVAPTFTAHEKAALFISVWDGLQTYDALNPGDVDPPELLARIAQVLFGGPASDPAPSDHER